MYSDEHLNHYADLYVALDLRDVGISLEQYLAAPGRYEAYGALLAPQRAVARRVALRIPDEPHGAHLRGGALIEPLHHRRVARDNGARGAVYRGRARDGRGL